MPAPRRPSAAVPGRAGGPVGRPGGTRGAKAPRRRTKWERRLASPKVPWIAGGLVLLVLICALSWRWHAARQPDYALDQIAVAIRRGDGAKLAYYADVSAVTEQVIDGTVDWLVSHRGPDAALAAADVSHAGSRAAGVQDAKATLQARADEAFTIATASALEGPVGPRVIDAFIQQPPLSLIMQGEHLDVRAIDRPLVDGATATVPLVMRHRELVVDVKIGLLLQREGPRWRLSGINGLTQALDAIDRAQMERLEIANRPREEELQSLLSVGGLQVHRVARRRVKPFYELRVPVSNRSTDSLTSVTLTLAPRGSSADHGTLLSVDHPIPPASSSAEVWDLDEATVRSTHLGSLLARPERLTLRLQSVVRDSAGQADTVRLLRRYEEIPKD